VKRRPFTIRLTPALIVKITLASYLLTIGVLLAIRYAAGGWIGHGPAPRSVWAIGLAVPLADLLFGLDILRATRRLALAKPLLFSGVVLGLFAAWTLWSWQGKG